MRRGCVAVRIKPLKLFDRHPGVPGRHLHVYHSDRGPHSSDPTGLGVEHTERNDHITDLKLGGAFLVVDEVVSSTVHEDSS
jgi:hypothetical protein